MTIFIGMSVNGGYKGELSYDEKNYETGIIRVPQKVGYSYFYVKNKLHVNKSDLERIVKLKLPPNWNNVWISGNASSAIQAIGIDAKGRKQYKYNEKHIQNAEKEKFLRLLNFTRELPKLERKMQQHSKLHVYDKNRVIATMLELVNKLNFRVGKEQYAKENKSYGISSLKKTHVKIEGDLIKFNFKGKSNQRHHYSLRNEAIKNHLNMLLKLDDEKLFQYIDENGTIRKVTDLDINHYIQEYMGKDFSVKDFRTYSANFYFVKTLLSEIKKHSNNVKKNIINAIKTAAIHLSHTKSISKKSYIMSFCIELYTEHPEYFTARKMDDPRDVLIAVLKKYKNSIGNK